MFTPVENVTPACQRPSEPVAVINYRFLGPFLVGAGRSQGAGVSGGTTFLPNSNDLGIPQAVIHFFLYLLVVFPPFWPLFNVWPPQWNVQYLNDPFLLTTLRCAQEERRTAAAFATSGHGWSTPSLFCLSGQICTSRNKTAKNGEISFYFTGPSGLICC